MWIKASGQLSENVCLLTTAISSHLLIGGEFAGLVDAGVAATAPRLLDEIGKFLTEPEELRYVFLTHAHFDHLGCIPAIRRYSPNVQVVGAPLTAEILAERATIQRFYQRNLEVAEAMQTSLDIPVEEWCDAIRIDRILGDGDVIDMGADVEVKLIASPGHTADSVSYYVRPDAALAVGEAGGGYSGRDKQSAAFASSFQNYMGSLDKLSSLEVKILGLPHAGVITGQLAGKYLTDARMLADRFSANVKERIQQGELIDEIYASILPEWISQNLAPEGPFVEEQGEILKAMIQCVAEDR